MIAAAAAASAWWVAEVRGWARPWAAAAGACAVALDLRVGIAAGAVWMARRRWRAAAGAAQRARRADEDVVLVAELMALGATAGLGIRSSLEAAGGHAGEEVGKATSSLLQAMDRRGVAAALAAEEGMLSGVARVLSGAAASGAPPAAALSAFAAARRHEQHAARLERARRLPVRLLLPLALLILPGFVVLAVGPAIFEGLARLGPLP